MASSTPSQTRAVDPFASYNSDTVNKLTRIVNLGEDCLESAKSCDIVMDATSTSKVILEPGVVYKDDVWINITAQHVIDFNDPDQYYNFNISSITTGYYYIVLSYTYQRQRPAPLAKVLIVTPDKRNQYIHGGDWLLLKVVNVTSVGPITISSVLSYDPDNPINRRIIATRYAGTEINLPTFNPLRDPSRLIFVENENAYYFGFSNGWSLPIEGSSSNASNIIITDTSSLSLGELVYITPTKTFAKAISTSKETTADGIVRKVAISGQVQLAGKIQHVPVESGITPSVGSLLYLSKNEPGKVTTIKPSPYYQFVGRCFNVDSPTTITILFTRGEAHETQTIFTYAETTLTSASWLGTGPYYQDIDISGFIGTNVITTLWDTSTNLQVVPANIELLNASTIRIWMPVNTLELKVLVVGPKSI